MLDPFSLKKHFKLHPKRLIWTLYARVQEFYSKKHFDDYKLPEKLLADTPLCERSDWSDTAVTQEQMSHILCGLKYTEKLSNSVVVEIGSYRGFTTQCLADNTRRTIVCVDPYIGYGGVEKDYSIFLQRTSTYKNVVHLRSTSGEAAASWKQAPISMVFIDAVHDYVNVTHDISVWSEKLLPGGILAIHDADDVQFPGSRRAIYEASKNFVLFAHPEGCAIFLKK